MGTPVTAPDGSVLYVDWDDPAQLWLCWPEQQPDQVVSADDRHLTGALAEALGFDVAHDDLPRWLGDLAGDVRASVPR